MHLRTRLTLGVATATAVTGALLTPVAAFAAPVVPNAQLTVDPTSTGSNLLDGQVVLLNGSGYAPNTVVYVVECADLAHGDPQSCDGFDGATNTDKVVTTQSDASGNISGVKFPVHTGPTGTVGGKCDATNSGCGIAATDSLDPTSPTAHFGAVGITFSKIQGSPLKGLHAGDKVTVTGVQLDPGIFVAVIQCGPDAQPDGSGCDQNQSDAAVTQTDTNGAFSTQFTIRTGEMQAGDPASACPPPAGATESCELVVEQVDFSTTPPSPVATLGILPITFGPPAVTPKVSAKSTKSSVSTGEHFKVKGRATNGTAGVNGLSATLYQRRSAGHAWSKVATKATSTIKGVAGSVAYALTGLKHSEQYYIKTAKKTIAGVIYNVAKSKVVTVA